jgi:2-dehydro-3-deoxygluconokinase
MVTFRKAGGVAAIGECMLELSTSDLGRRHWVMGHAGDTFNTLWTLAALAPADTSSCDYVTAFGDDPFSREQIDFMHEAGIGIAQSPIIPGARPGLYAITLSGAERSFTYWRSDSAARQLASNPAKLEKSLENLRLVYFSGITLAILEDDSRKTLLEALSTARKAGSAIAFDPNWRPRLWRSPDEARLATAAALALSDIALPTLGDETALWGDADAWAVIRRLRAAGAREIVVKDGPGPALVGSDEGIERIAAETVAQPVDTTGAGDAFNGAYLAARLAGFKPAEAARRAHRVGAAVVQVHGALAPFATLRAAFG